MYGYNTIDDEILNRQKVIERIVNENRLDSTMLSRPYIAAYGNGIWSIITKDSVGYSVYSVERIDGKNKMLYNIFFDQDIDVLEWFFNDVDLSSTIPELKPNHKFHMFDYYILSNGVSKPFVFNAADNFSGQPQEDFNDLIKRLSIITIWLSCPYLHPYMENPLK